MERLVRCMEMEYFATAAKGVEEVLAAEIRCLGIRDPLVEKGGVRFRGDLAACYKANLWLRTAQRILMPVARFHCDSPESLYEGVRSVPWDDYLTPDMTLAVSCNLRDSSITHSGFAALKTKDAIVDSVRDSRGRRPNVDTGDPHLPVNVHLSRNQCTVSLDTSGASLDKRGYRLDTKEAPLRETLAAAILELSCWDGSSTLLDPMCGSGTIPIEAALKASRRAPGLLRSRFAFQRWPGFDGSLWQRMQEEAGEQELAGLDFPLRGSDSSAGAIRNALRNARRAGVERLASFSNLDFGDAAPPSPPGIVICNPPYGVRLSDEEALKPLYGRLGDVLKRRFSGYTAYLLVGNSSLASCIGLRPSRRIVLFNGPIECRLLRYELY
ncbi:MAG: THUMP domain-containing protein [Geobacteraceae bacterium]|nr:THUMP domain-containing protein [Geobacteraceae bacterium]